MTDPRRRPPCHLQRACTAPAARVVAAFLAVSLSGAPRVLQLRGPLERHRCLCRHLAGERCECARCHRIAPAPANPPCHGSLGQGPRRHPAPLCNRVPALGSLRVRSSERSAPCIEGACGAGGDRAVVSSSGVDPFAPPIAPAIPVAAWSKPVRMPPGPSGDVEPPEPETPPPKPT
jgi:hypothetical protein